MALKIRLMRRRRARKARRERTLPLTLGAIHSAFVDTNVEADEPFTPWTKAKKIHEGYKFYMVKLHSEVATKAADSDAISYGNESVRDLVALNLFSSLDEPIIDALTVQSEEHNIAVKKVLQHGIEVFGKGDVFAAWLHSKRPSLGDVQPVSLLPNPTDLERVEEEIERIEEGMIS